MRALTTRVRKWLEWHSLYSHLAAPLWLRIPEKHRWTIVHHLDKSRRRCWSDLVSDALAAHEDDPCDVNVPSLRAGSQPACASTCYWIGHEGKHACACYCGKFQFTAADSYGERRGAVR